ncbi:MAG: RNA-binding protein [Solirubrobacterales bacterium]
MNKNTFIERLSSEDVLAAAKLYDKVLLSEKTGKTIYSNEFYPPVIWGNLMKLNSYFNLTFSTFGIFENAERRVVGIGSGEILDFPVNLVKIKAKGKFCSISHSDFLGAIMSLGIKRDKFGDLIIEEDTCYAAVHEEISDYLICNLEKVKNSPCEVNIIDFHSSEVPKQKFEHVNMVSTSLRLDCIVSSICNISRNNSDELIRQGKVLVDYFPVTKRDFVLDVNSLIVIRGYGKFVFQEIKGSTGKGRLKVQFKKFI